ncbi:MAG TPA: hypothetical protein VL098_04820 [Flavipsychrobacter sp.]|nr:hypothetical protein [Flavipsychrobacter sp.]
MMTIHLREDRPLSAAFRQRGITRFDEAIYFVRHLPYGRNADKLQLTTVFSDGCGTCSTKHAMLYELAQENAYEAVRLFVGLFRMNGENTPPVKRTLAAHQLSYIPEAHCYLKINGEIVDATKAHSKPSDFLTDLLQEIEIVPVQITDFKIAFHKNYLQHWLAENPSITCSPEELWTIREQCIKDLAT